MVHTPVRLTEAELAVLEPLWQQGPQTIRQLTALIYPAQSTSEYATVQKLLERLEAKRCVRRDRSAPAHQFAAIIEREALIDQQLQDIADRLCEGSLVPVLSQLIERVRLTKSDRQELEKLLETHRRPKSGKERS